MKLFKHILSYTLHKAFYILEKLAITAGIIFTIWAFLSWHEIASHNKAAENPEYSDYNLIILVMDAID